MSLPKLGRSTGGMHPHGLQKKSGELPQPLLAFVMGDGLWLSARRGRIIESILEARLGRFTQAQSGQAI